MCLVSSTHPDISVTQRLDLKITANAASTVVSFNFHFYPRSRDWESFPFSQLSAILLVRFLASFLGLAVAWTALISVHPKFQMNLARMLDKSGRGSIGSMRVESIAPRHQLQLPIST